MGYKYGVWLVYNRSIFPTTHIGHFTITCFMKKDDAFSLYKDILTKHGNIHYINVIGEDPVYFDKNLYVDDNNDMGSWGYKGTNSLWNYFKMRALPYKCNFSDTPHTSIEYFRNNTVNPIRIKNMYVQCTLAVADITNDDPTKWFILHS